MKILRLIERWVESSIFPITMIAIVVIGVGLSFYLEYQYKLGKKIQSEQATLTIVREEIRAAFKEYGIKKNE